MALVPDAYPVRENELEQNAPFSRSISVSFTPTVEITAGTLCIRFTNDVHPELLETILSAIGGLPMVGDITRAVNIYIVCGYTDYPQIH